MASVHQDGWVSIWVFKRPEVIADDVLEEIFEIPDYDLDTQDVVGDEDWKVLPVQELFGRLSYAETFAGEAVGESLARGISHGTRALAQYDLKYDPSEAPRPKHDDPVFAASVRYQKPK